MTGGTLNLPQWVERVGAIMLERYPNYDLSFNTADSSFTVGLGSSIMMLSLDKTTGELNCTLNDTRYDDPDLAYDRSYRCFPTFGQIFIKDSTAMNRTHLTPKYF